MRLTLRTMLAYMDGILEHEDAQDVGKKIDDSQYASGLMHRVRDVMRRLRLAAPGLSDRGPNLDPNTVAEYLDNTLADDRVPDFEKVCLESDIHLAEVGSCHQILTLVLGEPAEVDPASRERMYQIPQVLAAQVGANERITAAPQLEERAPVAAVDTPPIRPATEVPEYLREATRKQRKTPMLLGIAFLAVCVVAVLFALGMFDVNSPLGRLIGMGAGNEAVKDKPSDDGAVAKPDNIAPPQVDIPEVAPDPTLPPTEIKPVEIPAVEDPDNQVVPLPTVDNNTPDGIPQPGDPDAATGANNPGVETPVQPGEETPPKPDDSPVKPADVAENTTPIGRLISDKQVLLALDPKLDGYGRVPPKAIFLAGSRLLVLPTYKPEIGLSTGAHLRLLGGTEVSLLGADPQTHAGVNVFFGRMVIMPLASPGARVRLTVGERSGILTLSQAESVAALEVSLKRAPGSDPEKTPSQVVSTLYVASGEVLWDDGSGGKGLRLTSPEQMTLENQSPMAMKELPKWIQGEPLGQLDTRASMLFEQIITSGKPALTTLMELDDHRQKEMRWLAARSLAYLDRFDTLVAGLNQAEMKAEWPEQMAKLSDALALGPETAVAIREELRKQYGPDGLDAYHMLWGCTNESLQSGEAARLIKFLDHDILALRVLAYLNLKEITGAGLLYKPEQAAALRKQSTQRWKEKLSAGEIHLKGGEVISTRGVSSESQPDSIREESK